jgi:cardiolipin synthase
MLDDYLRETLIQAAERGVDVRLVTPGIPDKKIAYRITRANYPPLLKAGVKIYEYSGFIHEKLVVSDDEYALVGTINLDYRSLVHHYEDAVWIYGSNTVVSIREGYMKTLSVSRKMGKNEAKLNFSERLVRGAVRLFAPLL